MHVVLWHCVEIVSRKAGPRPTNARFRRVPRLRVTWLLRLSWPAYTFAQMTTACDGDPLIFCLVRRVTGRTMAEIPRHWLSLVSLPHFPFSPRFLASSRIPTYPRFYFAFERFFLLFQIQIREIFRKADRNPTPWELACAQVQLTVRVSIWNGQMRGLDAEGKWSRCTYVHQGG